MVQAEAAVNLLLNGANNELDVSSPKVQQSQTMNAYEQLKPVSELITMSEQDIYMQFRALDKFYPKPMNTSHQD